MIKQARLHNGVMMPTVGFGLYMVTPEDTERVVTDALEAGYRMFDTAASYGNEKQLGDAIRKSGIPREEIFITSKLWIQDYETEDALRMFDKTLENLGTDYLDLWLLHKPFGNYYAAWRVAEQLYKQGRIRAIGVTSFNNERLQDLILHNEIKPMVNQIETNPIWQQHEAEKFLKEQGIQHEAWAPFAEGKQDIFNNPVLKQIAEKYGKTTGNVILNWLNQRGVVVIPKSVRKERMIENLNSFDFTLTPEEMEAIKAIDQNKSVILDDQDLETAKWVGTWRHHD